MTDAPDSRVATIRGLVALFWRLVVVVTAALLTVAAVAWVVPEANDYAAASLKKHQRLDSISSPKVVLIGGSNLAFGIDSEMIANATGRDVVNMGMDAFLGLQFMMAEVESALDPSDLVIVILEYDSYYWDTAGVAENQFAVVKANPEAWSYLTDEQRWGIVTVVPRVAQVKVGRVVLESARVLRELVKGDAYQSAGQLSEKIGSVSGFNAYGDLTAHLDIDWPNPPFDGIELSKSTFNEDTLKRMGDFHKRLQERGVQVMVSYPPTTESYYGRNREEIDDIHRRILAEVGVPAPLAPAEFVFPEARFFDTVYHLKRQGRAERTKRLIKGVTKVLSQSPAANSSTLRTKAEAP